MQGTRIAVHIWDEGGRSGGFRVTVSLEWARYPGIENIMLDMLQRDSIYLPCQSLRERSRKRVVLTLHQALDPKIFQAE